MNALLPAALTAATLAAYGAFLWSLYFARPPATKPGRHTSRRRIRRPNTEIIPGLEVATS